jgi:hypothetical protein
MRKLWATLLGGATAGFLDEMSALSSLVPHGVSATRLFHYQASALIGPDAAKAGGLLTAALGVAVHFMLTTVMAGTFVAASQKLPVLLRKPWASGLAYGVLVYLVMNYIAVPLTAIPNWKAPTDWGIVSGLLAHCFFVGIPIAAIARAWLADVPATGPAAVTQPSLPSDSVSAPRKIAARSGLPATSIGRGTSE